MSAHWFDWFCKYDCIFSHKPVYCSFETHINTLILHWAIKYPGDIFFFKLYSIFFPSLTFEMIFSTLQIRIWKYDDGLFGYAAGKERKYLREVVESVLKVSFCVSWYFQLFWQNVWFVESLHHRAVSTSWKYDDLFIYMQTWNKFKNTYQIFVKGCWPYFGPDIIHYVFYYKWKGIIRAVKFQSLSW